MQGVIQKWGNSNAIRFPKPLLESVGFKENDPVEMTQVDDGIVIRKAVNFVHKPLRQRLNDAGVLLDYRIDSNEIAPTSVGDEVFW
jgi:antitoxin MazE